MTENGKYFTGPAMDTFRWWIYNNTMNIPAPFSVNRQCKANQSSILMKKILFRLTFAAMTTMASFPAHAQIIFGSATTDAGDSDVNLAGSFVSAFAVASDTAEIVNGVTFAATTSNNIYSTWGAGEGSITIATTGNPHGTGAFSVGAGNPFDTLSASYQVVAGTDAWSSGAPITLTFNNLIVGHTYEAQIWVGDSSNGNAQQARAETFTDSSGNILSNSVTLQNAVGNTTGAYGQFTIATFTASSGSEGFTSTGNVDVGYLAGVELRDTTAAVPEPSTWALLLLGMGTLVLGLRHRQGRQNFGSTI